MMRFPHRIGDKNLDINTKYICMVNNNSSIMVSMGYKIIDKLALNKIQIVII